MITMTEQQRAAIARIHARDPQGLTLDELAASAQPTIGMNGAVVLPWCGMWLAIEADGYTHS